MRLVQVPQWERVERADVLFPAKEHYFPALIVEKVIGTVRIQLSKVETEISKFDAERRRASRESRSPAAVLAWTSTNMIEP